MPDPYDDLIRGVVGSKPKGANYDPETALDLISQHESGGRNIKQNVVPAGGGYNPSVGRVTGPSTAAGPWQITNTTWNKRAPREIAQQYPTAMSAPVEVQRDVARKMYQETGFQDWAPYNASLRKAIARGEQPQQQPRTRTISQPDDEYSKLIRETVGDEQPTQQPTQKAPAQQGSWASTQQPQGWGRGTIGQGVKTAPVASERPRTRPKGIGGAQIEGEVAPSGGPQARQDLRRVSQAGGITGGLLSLLPQSAGDFITQGAAGAAAPLMQLGAGIIKKIPGVQDPLDPQRPDVTAPIRQKLNQGATKLQQENAAIDQSSQHYNVNVPVVGNVSTKDVREMGSGLVSSAPALLLQRMGVPGPVAFGLDAYLKAEGRDADFADVMKETGLATLTGGLYEISLPARMGLIKQIGAKLGLGTTGGYLLAKAFGLPEDEARKMAAQTGVMMATGAKRAAAPELAEAVPASKPREFAPTLAPSELAKRTALREGNYEGRTPITQEGIPQVPVAEPAPAEAHPSTRQNRRVRNVATGTKGQFKAGFKDEGVGGDVRPNESGGMEREAQPANIARPELRVTPPEPAQTETMQPSVSATEPQITPSPEAAVAAASTPEMKPSRLAQGVEAKAVEANLTQGFGELRSYTPVTVKDQAQRALTLLNENPEQARRIAMGDEEPPPGVHPESVFIAVENRAQANKDVGTLMDLATKGTLASENSVMGQRIRMLKERNPNSPVAAISKIQEVRAARIPKKQMQKVENQIKTEVNVEVRKGYPKGKEWSTFLDSIMCK